MSEHLNGAEQFDKEFIAFVGSHASEPGEGVNDDRKKEWLIEDGSQLLPIESVSFETGTFYSRITYRLAFEGDGATSEYQPPKAKLAVLNCNDYRDGLGPNYVFNGVSVNYEVAQAMVEGLRRLEQEEKMTPALQD